MINRILFNIIIGLIVLFFWYIFPSTIEKELVFGYVLLAILSVQDYYVVNFFKRKNKNDLTAPFFINLTVRFLFAGFFVLIIIQKESVKAPKVFALQFFILYLSYMLFEIRYILANLRAETKTPSVQEDENNTKNYS